MNAARVLNLHTIRIEEGGPVRVLQLAECEFVIGRDEAVEVSVSHPEISRRHCAVRISGSQVFVRDLGSASGTYVGSRRLGAGAEVRLEGPEFKITLGGVIHIALLAGETASPESVPAPVPALVLVPDVDQELLEREERKRKAVLEIESVQLEAVRFSEALKEEAKKEKEEARCEMDAMRAEAAQEVADLKAKRSQLQAEIQGQSLKISELRDEYSRVQAECSEQNKKFSAMRDALSLQVNDFEHKVQESRHMLSTSERVRAQVESEIEAKGREKGELARELKTLEENLRQGRISKEAHEMEERRHQALNEALIAEYRVKKLSLEASVGEVDLRRIKTEREYQILAAQRGDVELRIQALEKDGQRIRQKIECDQFEVARLKVNIKEEEASLAALRAAGEEMATQTRLVETGLTRAQSALLDYRKNSEAEMAQLRGHLDAEAGIARELLKTQIEELRQQAQVEIEREVREQEIEAARSRRVLALEEIVKAVLHLAREKPLNEAEPELRAAVKTSLEGPAAGAVVVHEGGRVQRYWKKIARFLTSR